MKSLIKNIGLGLLASVLLFTTSCKKEGGNPLADIANLSIGSYITLTRVVNLNFNYAQLATSAVGIKVTQYKTENSGSDVDKIKVYVVKGTSTDKTTWKLVKTVTYAGDSTLLSVTGAEMATALGVSLGSIQPGDFYTFYNQVITKDSRSFDIVNTPGALGSLSAYNAAFVWQAYITCPFTGGMAGNYRVIQDDWQDWSPGDIVPVTDGPGANQVNLSQVWPNPAYGNIVNPLIVNVNAADGVATVPLVTFANNYPGTATAQGANASGAGDTVPCGYVFSCTGFITLTMRVTYNGSSQGNLKLILQKL
ncbi:MAG: hypothetical protein HZB42_15445 [Sphingobacteriales bacterium]|nr:hypothetical protein [Sphingobacteriales bacterium]